MSSHTIINADSARYCYLDLDLQNNRSRLARAAAFVHATDARYGFSSKHLLDLGGSELARIPELMENDHEFSSNTNVLIRPPEFGSRIIVKMFWEEAPLACENFATLCANASATKVPIGESGKPLTYKGSTVHRIIPGFILQGGDFVFGNGSGGESIYKGKKFKDERAGLQRKHDRRGLLSMGNSGKNSNSSQWFFTLDKAPQCDGKHVVFGEIVSGWDVLEAAGKLGSTSGDVVDGPVLVTDCGIFTPYETPAAGYWFDQPDPEAYTGVSIVFRVRPRVAVVAPNDTIAQKFVQRLKLRHAVTVLQLEDCQRALDSLSVDVIVFSPAIDVPLLTLSSAWKQISIDNVAIQAKPIEAVNAITEGSWLKQKSWQLD